MALDLHGFRVAAVMFQLKLFRPVPNRTVNHFTSVRKKSTLFESKWIFNRQSLHLGRAHVGGALTTGKIHPSHNCIYVPFDGIEHSISQYEVLVAPRRCKLINDI